MSDIKKLKIKSEIEDSDNKDDKIPILLLSKDLMNQIDSNLDDDELIKIKKDQKDLNDINNYFHSSESSNDEEPEPKTKEKEIKNHFNNYDFLKSDNKEKTTYKNNSEINTKSKTNPNRQNNNGIYQSKLYNSLLYEINKKNLQEYINNINNNCNKEGNEREKQLFINQINNYNFDNKNFNQVNFISSCFTMNGKPGWICSYCNNFNYESKYII